MWFSLNGNKPNYEYSYKYQNWYPAAEYETKNCKENVGIFDLTPFSKFELHCEKAHDYLQEIFTSNIKNGIAIKGKLSIPL